MRNLSIWLSALTMGFAIGVGATNAAAQESEDARFARLQAFVEADGRGGVAMSRRLQMLTREDRAFMRDRAARAVSDYIAVCGPAGSGPNLCERGLATPPGARAAPVVAAAPPAAPSEPAMTPRRQAALDTWNRLYPEVRRQAAGQSVDRFALTRTGDTPFLGRECGELRAAADILGGDYPARNPCPTRDQIIAAQRGQQSRTDAMARQQAADIAETQRIADARAAAVSAAASAPSAGDIVTVRTYDAQGNYTGTRQMTRSQAATVGARPQ